MSFMEKVNFTPPLKKLDEMFGLRAFGDQNAAGPIKISLSN